MKSSAGVARYSPQALQIDREIAARNAAEAAFEKACGAGARGRAHAYEDLVDAAPDARKNWAAVLEHGRRAL